MPAPPTADSGGTLPADWLQRLHAGLLRAPEHRREYWRLGGTGTPPTDAMLASLPQGLTAAAVLVPLVEQQGEPHVLLTERATHLKHHAGQISFPGGRIEPGDAQPLAAALRETAEEIGVTADYLEPLGYLPDHMVLTGFRITPVVARLHAGYDLHVDEREVAGVFTVPLRTICDPTQYRSTIRNLHNFNVEVHDLPFGERLIWGATAGMLISLRDLLLGQPR